MPAELVVAALAAVGTPVLGWLAVRAFNQASACKTLVDTAMSLLKPLRDDVAALNLWRIDVEHAVDNHMKQCDSPDRLRLPGWPQ